MRFTSLLNERMADLEFFIGLIIAGFLALIPVSIAKKKGRANLGAWWFYGWLLFIVALIHALCMEDYNSPKASQPVVQQQGIGGADELMKYKKLLDDGIITQEEFAAKKKQLLGL